MKLLVPLCVVAALTAGAWLADTAQAASWEQHHRRSLTTDGNIGRALQQASSPPVCTWVGAKDGSCKDYPRDGCCRVNPAYLLQNFPDSLANKMAVFPSDPTVCTRILAPTKLDSVNLKSADVDRCFRAGSASRCYVTYDPDADTVSCEQQTLWTGTDSLASCEDSFQYNYVTCLQARRGQCTSGANAGRCTNVFSSYFKDVQKLSKAKLGRLQTLMGGASMPKLRDTASCVSTDVWTGATQGNADRPFAASWRDLGTFYSNRVRTGISTKSYEDVWGKGCLEGARRKRAAIADAQCSALGLNEADATSTDPTDTPGPAQLQKCLATENCEVGWEPLNDGTSAQNVYCRAAPSRAASLVGTVGLEATDSTALFAAYQACYLPSNRFSRDACTGASTYPVENEDDLQRRM